MQHNEPHNNSQTVIRVSHVINPIISSLMSVLFFDWNIAGSCDNNHDLINSEKIIYINLVLSILSLLL